MRKSRVVRVAAAAIIGMSGTAFAATAAFALPSGCSQSINAFGQLGGDELFAQLGGSCKTSVSRTLQGEIKHDLTLRPDAVALQGADVDSKNYLVALQGCDHGNSGTYYARVFFKGNSDYLDSDHKKYDVC